MSNATQHSRQSGDSRRRRSRGGKNRNRNQQGNRRGGERGQRDQQSNRAEEFRPKGPRPPRGSRPVKLTWWQKLLQAIGLYKAPAPQPRRERKQDESKPKGEPKAPKSNTRNARSADAATTEKSAEGGSKRGRRGGRGGERPRGGDSSAVESSRVYVGNLSYDVTEQDLQELFKGIGGVRNVEIVYNRSTHRSKGYGFVEMLHQDEAVRAVEVLHDQPFMGRTLTVSGAKSKGQDEREDKEERPANAPVQVALAPLPEETAAPETQAEPQIETIVENVAEEAPAAEAPAEAGDQEDLVAKYGFDDSEKKSTDA